MSEAASEPTGGGSKRTIALVALVIVGMLVAGRYFDLQTQLGVGLAWIEELGFVGQLLFIGFYIVSTVLLIPGSALTLGAGAVFGTVLGSILTSIGATLGATAAFLVGRYFARDWVSSKIENNPKFKAIDAAVADEGWKIVGLTRLSPVFPFTLLNYAFGVTRVSLRDYVFASWIGMIPGTVMYVYIGSLAGNIAATAAGAERATTTGELALRAVGLVATIAVTVYVTKVARKALDERIP